ncbi:MAG: hypothetical protein Q4A37_01040 [Candidatus Saccharibacteria bacterium]|nr:hypothetical protein [Candidatus Saccharibacteria bacterium]
MTKPRKLHIFSKTSTAVWAALFAIVLIAIAAAGLMRHNYDLNNRLYNIEFDSRLVDLTHEEENRRLAFCLKHDIKDCTPEMIADWNSSHKDNQFSLKTQEQISRELAESLPRTWRR